MFLQLFEFFSWVNKPRNICFYFNLLNTIYYTFMYTNHIIIDSFYTVVKMNV